MADLFYLISSLAGRDDLTAADREIIAQMPFRMRQFRKGEQLVVEHSRPNESCLVFSGLTAREVFLADGARQITALHIPGDFVDLHAFLLKVMDHSVVALTDCEAGFVPHSELLRISERAPHLTRLFWLSTVIDAAIQRAWIACIGRRSPKAHISHLVCELFLRYRAIGVSEGMSFPFQVTQADLADMLGLSLVHVNRTLQELRRTGLMSWEAGRVTILDFEGISQLADFDPTYLNLVREPR